MSKPVDAGSLKVGSFIVIDNEPCKIMEIEKSKPGKHGSAKCRIVAIGLFDGNKRSIVVPADSKVEVPIVNKKTAQVLALLQDTIQLMDLSTYEVYEVPVPEDEDLRKRISPGVEVEVWEVLGRRKIMRIK
ncbi:MAG: translation initiation factor IF-5A [Thermoprotei archaeon]|nr:MAG: translation initiation factor IF-5A [Thermoprotei archaeon]RLE99277.1 MAG: translation initiation factor IF-5A [Thermoprotei archaeon]HDI75169.1 translation initiation factor IF-5A [Thermoprotei archaeon]